MVTDDTYLMVSQETFKIGNNFKNSFLNMWLLEI